MESRRSRSLLLLFPRFPLMVQRLLVPSLPVLNLLGSEVGAGGENTPATRLDIFSVGLNLRDGLVQRYVTQPLLSLLCAVSLAHRELIEKTNGVNNTHLFKENVSGSRLISDTGLACMFICLAPIPVRWAMPPWYPPIHLRFWFFVETYRHRCKSNQLLQLTQMPGAKHPMVSNPMPSVSWPVLQLLLSTQHFYWPI